MIVSPQGSHRFVWKTAPRAKTRPLGTRRTDFAFTLTEASSLKSFSMSTNRKEVIVGLLDEARNFRSCGPSDDPDEQTAVTSEYRHLVLRFKRIVGPILPEPTASYLKAIDRRKFLRVMSPRKTLMNSGSSSNFAIRRNLPIRVRCNWESP